MGKPLGAAAGSCVLFVAGLLIRGTQCMALPLHALLLTGSTLLHAHAQRAADCTPGATPTGADGASATSGAGGPEGSGPSALRMASGRVGPLPSMRGPLPVELVEPSTTGGYTPEEYASMAGGSMPQQFWEPMHCPGGAKIFHVRGPRYLTDKKKVDAGGWLAFYGGRGSRVYVAGLSCKHAPAPRQRISSCRTPTLLPSLYQPTNTVHCLHACTLAVPSWLTTHTSPSPTYM